jgi:hypothetical protein
MDEFEYKVQHRSVELKHHQGWSDSGIVAWVDEATAVRRFKEYVDEERRCEEESGVKFYEYRVVRRPKDSETVYLTEGEEI